MRGFSEVAAPAWALRLTVERFLARSVFPRWIIDVLSGGSSNAPAAAPPGRPLEVRLRCTERVCCPTGGAARLAAGRGRWGPLETAPGAEAAEAAEAGDLPSPATNGKSSGPRKTDCVRAQRKALGPCGPRSWPRGVTPNKRSLFIRLSCPRRAPRRRCPARGTWCAEGAPGPYARKMDRGGGASTDAVASNGRRAKPFRRRWSRGGGGARARTRWIATGTAAGTTASLPP